MQIVKVRADGGGGRSAGVAEPSLGQDQLRRRPGALVFFYNYLGLLHDEALW